MKKIVVSASALFLALGVLTGCGEKEAPKAEAPKAEAAKPAAAPVAVEQAAPAMAPVAAPAPSSNPMTAMTDAANSAATAMGDAAKAAGTAATQAADSATQAAADAAKAAGDATTKAAGAVDGEKVYKGLCFSCHDSGVAGAPKLGDKAAWAPRIATGNDALHTSSLKGKNAMPAKGGNPALSDAEVMAAVDFMVSKAK